MASFHSPHFTIFLLVTTCLLQTNHFAESLSQSCLQYCQRHASYGSGSSFTVSCGFRGSSDSSFDCGSLCRGCRDCGASGHFLDCPASSSGSGYTLWYVLGGIGSLIVIALCGVGCYFCCCRQSQRVAPMGGGGYQQPGGMMGGAPGYQYSNSSLASSTSSGMSIQQMGAYQQPQYGYQQPQQYTGGYQQQQGYQPTTV